jgi:uncharacterized protein
MNWEPISEKDKSIITKQIQREPRNLHGVARRCTHQCPQVSVNYPLSKKEQDAVFFPTVFWLTCPEAVRMIGKIEDQGFIGQIQEHVNTNSSLSEILEAAHQEYIYIRRTLLDPKVRIQLRNGEDNSLKHIEKVGIGGVSDLKGIKCLHMHYAHYLATRNNPIGELVEKMIRLSKEKWQCKTCHNAKEKKTAGVAE